jgi:hypothetical protein
VYARSDISPVPWISALVVADDEGRFRIGVIAGRRYRLIAEVGQPPTTSFRRGEMAPFDVTSDWSGLLIEVSR